MRKCFIKSNQKIQHKKVNQNLIFLLESLLLCNNQVHMGYFAPQHNGAKEWWRKKWLPFGWVFVYFQWKNQPHTKYKNQQSNLPFRPPKDLKLQRTSKTETCCLPLTNEWKRKRKEICERNGFCTQKWGSSYPSSWWFFGTLAALGAFYLVCVHQNWFAMIHTYMDLYYLYTKFCYS